MNARDRKATLAVKLELSKLYDALATETKEELEVRLLSLTADLEAHLSKVYCVGLCDKCSKA